MLFGTVLCLGDSLTFGARADVDGHAGLGYPEHLPPMLDAATGAEWAVLNRGISGQTTRQILDRAPGAFRELAASPGPKWAVVLAGTNDSKGAGVNHDEWEALFVQVCHWARRSGTPLAVCTFPPVDPKAMPAFTSASKAWLREASRRVRALAAKWDNAPSPVRLVELSDLDPALLCDGVHLTPEGYRAVARRVADVLLRSDDPASKPASGLAGDGLPDEIEAVAAPRRRRE